MSAEIKELFEGTWKLDRHENYQNYLDAAGVTFIEKKILIRVKPTWTISVEDDVIIIEVKTSIISFKNHIKLGEEYTVSHLGRKAKGYPTYSNGKMHTQFTPISKGDKPAVFVRELVDGEMVHTLTIDGVVSKHYLRRVEGDT